MAWHSQAWSHAASTKLHPLVSLDPTAPTNPVPLNPANLRVMFDDALAGKVA